MANFLMASLFCATLIGCGNNNKDDLPSLDWAAWGESLVEYHTATRLNADDNVTLVPLSQEARHIDADAIVQVTPETFTLNGEAIAANALSAQLGKYKVAALLIDQNTPADRVGLLLTALQTAKHTHAIFVGISPQPLVAPPFPDPDYIATVVTEVEARNLTTKSANEEAYENLLERSITHLDHPIFFARILGGCPELHVTLKEPTDEQIGTKESAREHVFRTIPMVAQNCEDQYVARQAMSAVQFQLTPRDWRLTGVEKNITADQLPKDVRPDMLWSDFSQFIFSQSVLTQ